MARNAHMALVYRGPQDFRTHTFQFEFWPKTAEEAIEFSQTCERTFNGQDVIIFGPPIY